MPMGPFFVIATLEFRFVCDPTHYKTTLCQIMTGRETVKYPLIPRACPAGFPVVTWCSRKVSIVKLNALSQGPFLMQYLYGRAEFIARYSKHLKMWNAEAIKYFCDGHVWVLICVWLTITIKRFQDKYKLVRSRINISPLPFYLESNLTWWEL